MLLAFTFYTILIIYLSGFEHFSKIGKNEWLDSIFRFSIFSRKYFQYYQ